VIGGLIQSLEEHRMTKVPLLGDIPLAGWLFRSKLDSETKTELLVILTPKVVYGNSPGDVARLEQISNEKINQAQNPSELRRKLEQRGFTEPVPEQKPEEAPPDAEPAVPPRESPAPTPSREGETYRPSRRG
jgi:type II secretory pathway component GspD/PulD (secretin)